MGYTQPLQHVTSHLGTRQPTSDRSSLVKAQLRGRTPRPSPPPPHISLPFQLMFHYTKLGGQRRRRRRRMSHSRRRSQSGGGPPTNQGYAGDGRTRTGAPKPPPPNRPTDRSRTPLLPLVASIAPGECGLGDHLD